MPYCLLHTLAPVCASSATSQPLSLPTITRSRVTPATCTPLTYSGWPVTLLKVSVAQASLSWPTLAGVSVVSPGFTAVRLVSKP